MSALQPNQTPTIQIENAERLENEVVGSSRLLDVELADQVVDLLAADVVACKMQLLQNDVGVVQKRRDEESPPVVSNHAVYSERKEEESQERSSTLIR